MNAVVMMLFGAGCGAGVVFVLRSLVPVAPPIDDIMTTLDRPGLRFGLEPEPVESFWRGHLVRMGSALALETGNRRELERQLAVAGRSVEEHALRKAAYPALAVMFVAAAWVVFGLTGLPTVPIWFIVVAAAAGAIAFLIPDIRLRSEARARRTAFRHALSAYLDLVTVIMSGGAGLLTALQAAADAGDGWAFAEIRESLDRARLSNRTPWSQLGVLGERFEIAELQDLVAAAELAGSEGARISESISTKSDVLRSRMQAEIEQSAESLTEQMLIPVGLVLVALFLFLGYAVFDQLGSTDTPTFVDAMFGPVEQQPIGRTA